ncbi:sensor histidine kinase [Marinobacter apostichopi]|uniref:sensor histidine kinase n=1 Tax=Marinobacter apostichopi TaxID=3035454 RepID=UPI002572C447|nr:HAMP domain-containing sensor histidine kinase [Marinobacter sp. LA51]
MNPQVIMSQQSSGFRRLRFCTELEPAYRQRRALAVRERARLVSAAGLLIFGIFILLDLATLPPELADVTVTIRLTVACPVIALIYWLSHQRWPGDLAFERLYTLAYLAGGWSVVAIIAAARLRDFPLPYEGMLLMLMFGYFAMGLPFFSASLASALIILAYLICELTIGLATHALMINLFFILTANGIGMIGAWLTEYRHRAHYLDQQLIHQLHQTAAEESERKSRLITVASHDLRQPLNIIGLTLSNLAETSLPTEQQALVHRLQGTVGHFQRLLGTMLDSSRINEGMIHPEPQVIDLDGLLEQLIDLTIDHADLHDISLYRAEAGSPIRVLADPQLLLRTLQNLVFNGIDHSGGTAIRISAMLRHGLVRISVSDNGSGIDPQLGDRVFQPFMRGTVNQEHAAGLGLGLAIVKELTELMHGTCGVSTAVDAGTTFWLDLPALPLTPAQPPIAQQQAHPWSATASPSGVPD